MLKKLLPCLLLCVLAACAAFAEDWFAVPDDIVRIEDEAFLGVSGDAVFITPLIVCLLIVRPTN